MKDGFLLIDKEENYTSRDVCNIVMKRLNVKKVGHAGTLDPFATGLLIVGINNATKALSYIEGQYKSYEATLLLGEKTSSGDHTNEVIERKEVPPLDEKIINEVFSSLLGENEQTVPITSAVHVGGRKLYQYAHLNQEVELPKRTIFIKDIKLISFDKNMIKFSCTVSKGTYIRVLGEDIAEKLQTVGHLIALRRTKILDIDVSRAYKLNELKEESMINITDLLSHFMPIITLSDENELKKGRHGGKLSLKLLAKKEEIFCLSDQKNQAIAIYKYSELGYYECVRGLSHEDY